MESPADHGRHHRLAPWFRAQFTAQAINVFNHAQFTAPNTTPTSTAFGQVSAEFAWQRVIELGLKLSF